MLVPWNRGKPLFVGTILTFDEMYPKFEAVSIEYEECGVFKGDDSMRLPKNERSSVREMGPNVRCGNPDCNSGYLFQAVIDSMVAGGEAKREGRMSCHGTERVIRRERRPCVNSISYVVKLVPKS